MLKDSAVCYSADDLFHYWYWLNKCEPNMALSQTAKS